MAGCLSSCLLLLPSRIVLALGSAGYWLAVYWLSAFMSVVMLLRLACSAVRRPREVFRWRVRQSPPSCLTDPSLGSHCYFRVKDSGLRFHYVEAGDRTKPLMLLLHGFPELWYSWRHQLREFKSKYRVVAMDLRGYGESDSPAGKGNYKMECLQGDIKDIVEHLGQRSCILVGHDWGGVLAWHCAIYNPEMVERLIILNAPHPSNFQDYISRHPSQLLKSTYMFFFQAPILPELVLSADDFKGIKRSYTSRTTGIQNKNNQLTEEELEAYIYSFSQPGALTAPLNYYRNIFSKQLAKCHNVLAPTLVIWGERDGFLEIGLTDYMEQYVHNTFRLKVVPGASHWVQQDQPDVVNKLIWTFLAETNQ